MLDREKRWIFHVGYKARSDNNFGGLRFALMVCLHFEGGEKLGKVLGMGKVAVQHSLCLWKLATGIILMQYGKEGTHCVSNLRDTRSVHSKERCEIFICLLVRSLVGAG